MQFTHHAPNPMMHRTSSWGHPQTSKHQTKPHINANAVLLRGNQWKLWMNQQNSDLASKQTPNYNRTNMSFVECVWFKDPTSENTGLMESITQVSYSISFQKLCGIQCPLLMASNSKTDDWYKFAQIQGLQLPQFKGTIAQTQRHRCQKWRLHLPKFKAAIATIQDYNCTN